MVDINQDSLRRELISLYELYILKEDELVIDRIKKMYNDYHRPADDEILDKDLCIGIQTLYAIAWDDIAKISKTPKPDKNKMLKILLELKKNIK